MLVSLTSPAFGYASVGAANITGGWTEGEARNAMLDGLVVPRVPSGPMEFLEVYWINILGNEYIDFLRPERLEGLPVHRRWCDSGGRLWLQVTELPEGMLTEEGEMRRKQFRSRTDMPEAFPSVPFLQRKLRTPEFDRSEIQRSRPRGPAA